MNYENLDALKQEIDQALREKQFAIFYGMERSEIDRDMSIVWDSAAHPDFREFIAVAEAAGIKIMVVHYKVLPTGQISELLGQLDELDLDREERRNLARDLTRLKMYEGFVSSLDLSFDHATQTYLFAATTSWYKQLLEILQQFEVFAPGFGGVEDIDDEPISGGYFSKN